MCVRVFSQKEKSPMQELRELTQMKKDGLINEAQFEVMKQDIFKKLS